MPGPNKTYQYKSNDNPLDLATQHGVTPQQLYAANPGGLPFSTGQTINIPLYPGIAGSPNYVQPGQQVKTTAVQYPLYPGVPGSPAFKQPTNFQYSNAPQYPGIPGSPNFQNPTQTGTSVVPLYGPNNPAPAYTPPPNKAAVDYANKYLQDRGNYYQQHTSTTTPSATGTQYAQSYLSDRAAYFQQQTEDVANAVATGAFPDTMTQESAASLNLDPTQIGYILQNGVWRHDPQAAAAAANAPTTDNNWQTNPALHMIQYNKGAKNRRSTFQTNLKWAQNAWRRKKQIAKGDRTSGKYLANQAANAGQQNSITGFGLVDFGASSG